MDTGHQHIVILGAGTGGTLTANRLRSRLPEHRATITVVDQYDQHVYQPGLLFVPFGLADPLDIVKPRHRQLHRGINYLQQAVDRVETGDNTVHLADGSTLHYDVLIVATGAVLLPGETEGLTGPGWTERVFTFYDLDGATRLAEALESFEGGELVVNVVDLPIKCPVAPLEFCFLADWFFTERGRRDDVKITYVTPLDGAFTKPTASTRLSSMLADKGIELVTEFNTGTVHGDTDEGHPRIESWDERTVDFDLAVVIPLHGGAPFVGRSPGLGDDLDFVTVDQQTLQSSAAPNVFAIGDATSVPASKAGSVTHFEGEVLVDNVVAFLEGHELRALFDGHANCFIETGFGKAMLIDFNYDTEPLPGHFPGKIGAPLLAESKLNHLGKLMFQWFYWHVLLPGRDIPGLGSAMPTAGKESS